MCHLSCRSYICQVSHYTYKQSTIFVTTPHGSRSPSTKMKEREIHDLVAEVYSDNRLTNKLKLELKNLISLYSHQAPRVLVIFIFFILYLWMSVAPKIQTSLPLFLKPINFRKICLYTSHVSTSFERDKTRREDKLMICLVI